MIFFLFFSLYCLQSRLLVLWYAVSSSGCPVSPNRTSTQLRDALIGIAFCTSPVLLHSVLCFVLCAAVREDADCSGLRGLRVISDCPRKIGLLSGIFHTQLYLTRGVQ